ncbi:MAG: M90 family metallopeptidase [Planctomycetota bacterium]
MFFSWLKRRRRRRLLARSFPDPWTEILDRNVYHYAGLTEPEQTKLRDDLRILVAEKNWEGCGGLAMTDEIKVTIAAQAALLLIGFAGEYFDMVQSILVYPDAYVAEDQTITKGGVVLDGESHREGEAWYRGPVILSWADALAGGRHESDGDNLVLHEFAHQLDMQNGRSVDGTPPLTTRQQYDRWQEVMTAEFHALEKACRRGRRTLLDCYGTENFAEFFAVSTECFFELPYEMLQQHPRLYEILHDFYRQDPAHRTAQSER